MPESPPASEDEDDARPEDESVSASEEEAAKDQTDKNNVVFLTLLDKLFGLESSDNLMSRADLNTLKAVWEENTTGWPAIFQPTEEEIIKFTLLDGKEKGVHNNRWRDFSNPRMTNNDFQNIFIDKASYESWHPYLKGKWLDPANRQKAATTQEVKPKFVRVVLGGYTVLQKPSFDGYGDVKFIVLPQEAAGKNNYIGLNWDQPGKLLSALEHLFEKNSGILATN